MHNVDLRIVCAVLLLGILNKLSIPTLEGGSEDVFIPERCLTITISC